MDLMGTEILARIFSPTTSTELEDGLVLVERHTIVDGWSRIKNEWILLKDDLINVFTPAHGSPRNLAGALLFCDRDRLADISKSFGPIPAVGAEPLLGQTDGIHEIGEPLILERGQPEPLTNSLDH